ncbi:MAG TPA: LptF/LptG family permease [Chitinophagaceae bacterium]|nr:LptF/LptG family permease [Chitinophagaceae bacterium]
MKKLDKLLIRTFIGPFVVTFFVTQFVLIMQFLWKYIDDLVGKGLDLITVSHLLFYMSATMVPLALPLAILLSSIMTFGNLGESFELIALKSSGISLLRFMRPLLLLSGLICILAFLFSNYAIPWANLQAESLLYDIVNLKHGFNIREGVFFNELDGYSIRVGRKDPDGRHIYDVIIYDSTQPNDLKFIAAKSGVMEQSANKKLVYFQLRNGWQYEERGNGASLNNEFIRAHFSSFRKVFDLSSLALTRTPIVLFKDSYRMLDEQQLTTAVDSIKKQSAALTQIIHSYVTSKYAFSAWKDSGWLRGPVPALNVSHFIDLVPMAQRQYVMDNVDINVRESLGNIVNTVLSFNENQKQIRKNQIEEQRKLTLSVACMVLFLIGAPLGSIIRRGGLGTPLVFAVVFFVIFNVVSTIGERLADKDVLTAFGGMWLSTFVLIPIACFLVYQALNDSQLFNKEFYYRLFHSIRTRLQKLQQTD